jgi:hypothetical protein
MEFNVKGADTRKFIVEKLKKNNPAAVWEAAGRVGSSCQGGDDRDTGSLCQ